MLYIIIPVHNRKEFTRRCLLSLRQQTYKDFKIIVVDDGSTDGTGEMLAVEFPEVHVIKGDGNLWWTGAINLGVKYVLKIADDYDYILLFNNDTEVEKNYLLKMSKLVKLEQNIIIGSVEVEEDSENIIKSGGVIIKIFRGKMCVLNKNKELKDFDNKHYEYVDVLTGRGTLYPIIIFKKIGLFDSLHFPHYGDFDLPLRARKQGYKLIVFYNLIVKSFKETKIQNNIQKKNIYNLQDFWPYFFDKHSNANIISRWYLSKNINSNILIAVYFFIINMIRNLKRFVFKLKI